MQRMIPVDKLARPEDHILLPANRTRNARSEQGLSPGNAMPYEDDFLKSRMHGICGGEFQAMEAAGRTLYDFPDAPWEFQLDMARQVWDESRHAEIYMKLLEYVGSYYGEFPEGEVLWSCTQAEDPAARVAGINRGLVSSRRAVAQASVQKPIVAASALDALGAKYRFHTIFTAQATPTGGTLDGNLWLVGSAARRCRAPISATASRYSPEAGCIALTERSSSMQPRRPVRVATRTGVSTTRARTTPHRPARFRLTATRSNRTKRSVASTRPLGRR